MSDFETSAFSNWTPPLPTDPAQVLREFDALMREVENKPRPVRVSTNLSTLAALYERIPTLKTEPGRMPVYNLPIETDGRMPPLFAAVEYSDGSVRLLDLHKRKATCSLHDARGMLRGAQKSRLRFHRASFDLYRSNGPGSPAYQRAFLRYRVEHKRAIECAVVLGHVEARVLMRKLFPKGRWAR